METVHSLDGTTIAYDRIGSGPTVVLVDGALVSRASDQSQRQLVELLSQKFTVVHYDRRGRGESSDTQPFAVAREIEDIAALIDAVGGPAMLYGISSGAALAFEAACALGERVARLAMYEAPYNDEPAARAAWRAYRSELATAVGQGRPGDALGLFMMLVGVSADDIAAMRSEPWWPPLEATAPTLVYDAAALGEEAAVPTAQARELAIPALVLAGGATPFEFMRVSAQALAEALPNGQFQELPGQTHEVESAAIAPVLAAFFRA